MSNKVQFKDSDTYHVVTTMAGDITKVDVYHKETGLHARGNSKRYHQDIYDYNLGRRLAYYRALARVSQKIVIKTVKDLVAS